MKYKNYKNPYTNDGKIYSFTDLYNMPFGELIRRKQEVLSQYKVLGVPTEEELQASENVVHVDAYTHEDGTEVKAHYRSKPGNGSVLNSESSETGRASSIDDKDFNGIPSDYKADLTNYMNDLPEQEIKTEENINMDLYPQELAGVKRGKEMTFKEADSGKVNPNFEHASYEKDGEKYYSNCQSCVVAYEARRRGYDVEASPMLEDNKAKELSNTLFDAWIDPDTNEICKTGTEIDVVGGIDCYEYLNSEIKQGERYSLIYGYIRQYDGEESFKAHVMNVEKDEQGNLILYDPQDGGIRQGEAMKAYIDTWMGSSARINPQILRIDNKIFNPYYINDIVVPSKKK